MKKKHYIIGILILSASCIFSQSLQQIMMDNGTNYRKIKEAISKDSTILSAASQRDQKEFDRWDRYWRTRVDSTGNMNIFIRHLRDYTKKSVNIRSIISTKSAPTNIWTCEGPNSRPIGTNKTIGQGLVSAIWVDPDNHDTILIGGSNAGLWKTTNGGTNWICKTEGLMTGGVKDIAVHPTNKSIIYIVTQVRINNGMRFRSIGQYSLGIFKSTDGAETWTRLNTDAIPDEEYFSKVLINPTNPNILYALTINEVYKSVDSGATWTSKNIGYSGGLTYGLTEMEFKPGNPNTIYVSGGNALYRTTDGGDKWNSLIGNLTLLTGDAYIALAVDVNSQNDLYAFYIQGSTESLEKSTDSGNTFTSSVNPNNVYAASYIIKIWIAPDGDIFAGGVSIARCRTGLNSFTSLPSNLIHDDKRDCCFPDPSNGDLIYLATDGGVYMDTNDGDSWENITGDLPINEFVSLDITRQDPEVMFGGTMDCGSYMRNQDGTWTWKEDGDGGRSLLDQNDYNTYYYTISGKSFHRQEYSTDVTLFTLAYYDSPIIMDPHNSEILYRSTSSLFQRSTNKGDNWSTLMNITNPMVSMSICETNSDVYFFATWSESTGSGQIYKSLNGGISHTEVSYTGISDIIQVAPVTDIKVHPFDENIVWITFGGFDANKKVYYSDNGGNSWINKTGTGLEPLPVQCFEYDFLNGYIYVGTDVGMYYKSINDLAWQEVDEFPKAVVTELLLNTSSGDLVAATYGRGVWRTNLGDGYCYDDTPLIISSSTTWADNREVCSDIVIASGGTLNIQGTTTLSYKVEIIVQSSGTLKIDGGELIKGKIIVENGGRLEISDGGVIDLHAYDHLEINPGGVLDLISGEIQ